MGKEEGEGAAYRDLKEPEGCRFSSLRNMRLWGETVVSWWARRERHGRGNRNIPSGGLRQSGGLDQRGLDPGLGEVSLRHASHDEDGLYRIPNVGNRDRLGGRMAMRIGSNFC